MQINLSMEQADLLLELLNEKKRSLSLEIAHTTRREFKQTLQHQEFVLDGLLESVHQSRSNVLQECP